jgi:aminomethyltransferase
VSVPAEAVPLKHTPLYDLHRALGARMVAFAGYEMPVQYPSGIIAEHLHTRAKAGLFDVSHMGQIRLHGAAAARALEALVPGDLQGLAPGRMRYTLLLDEAGGILDDLIATRTPNGSGPNGSEGGLMLVVNAARKEADLAHIETHLDPAVAVEARFERALLALQGPEAAAVLARLAEGLANGVERMAFMSAADARIAGAPCVVTRSGYTGEDGFELSLAAADAARVAEALLGEPEVAPIGLGARDTLRLEAGLCLYGHDIDETTTPVEAGLSWTIARNRRAAGGFPGASTILRQLAEGPGRKRVGLRPDGRAPAREGTAILDAGGNPVGRITSGGFGPSLGAPIAMGYVDTAHAALGNALALVVRDVPRPAHVAPLPFVPTRYYRPHP